jgi:hypothetical protein
VADLVAHIDRLYDMALTDFTWGRDPTKKLLAMAADEVKTSVGDSSAEYCTREWRACLRA